MCRISGDQPPPEDDTHDNKKMTPSTALLRTANASKKRHTSPERCTVEKGSMRGGSTALPGQNHAEKPRSAKRQTV